MPKMKEIEENYERIHRNLYHRRVTEFGTYKVFKHRLNAGWHKIALNMISRFDIKSKRVLEVGSGYGVLSVKLSKEGAIVTSIDISSEALKISRKYAELFGTSVNLVKGDAQLIPSGCSLFDFVISCETIEHIPNYERALEEMIRCTRQGGYILITFPNVLNPVGFVAKALSKQPIDHGFTYYSILKKLRQMKKVRILEIGVVFLPSSRFLPLAYINRAFEKTPFRVFAFTVGILLQRNAA